MIVPPFLKLGDTLGIVAPGRKVLPENIDPAIEIIQSWGLTVKRAANLYSQQHSYLAGTDAERLADFQSMINDPTVHAILCARGGYGSSKFIDQLDLTPLKKNPKWIVGFSDVTAIHLKLFKADIQSIHGTMPLLFLKSDSAPSVQSLKDALFGHASPIKIKSSAHNRLGNGVGQMIGGNLSLVIDSLGTASEPDTNGKILFIEEIEEYKYKIDRMLNHLKRAGKLQHLSGLIVGHMTNVQDTELSFGESVADIVLGCTKEFNYPIVFDFHSGHENPNLAWYHGAFTRLECAAEKVEITFDAKA